MRRELVHPCPRGSRPAHTTVAKSQAPATKDPRDEPGDKPQNTPALLTHRKCKRDLRKGLEREEDKSKLERTQALQPLVSMQPAQLEKTQGNSPAISPELYRTQEEPRRLVKNLVIVSATSTLSVRDGPQAGNEKTVS